MTRNLILLVVLFVAGVAGGEEPELEIVFGSPLWYPEGKQSVIFYWEEPECPEGYGPVTVELPPEFVGYDKAVFKCARVAEGEPIR